MARDRYGNLTRYVGQITGGANLSPAYPGEHVEHFTDLEHARMWLREMDHNDDATALLWKVDPHDSNAEAESRTLSEAAHADYLLSVGPYGGVRTERL